MRRGPLDPEHFSGGRNLTRGHGRPGQDLGSLLDDLRAVADALYQGEATFTTLYVDGALGDDEYDGTAPVADGAGAGPKATITAALDAIPMFALKDYFIKIAPGTYADTPILGRHKGASINLIGSVVEEHTGTVVDYRSTGLNPVGFHQVQVSGFALEASDDQKWLRFDFDNGPCEVVKILTVLAADTVEVGAARLSGRVDLDYEDTGIGGHCTGVAVLSEGVAVQTDEQYLVRAIGSGPQMPSAEIKYLGAFYSFFGIKFLTTHANGSALYMTRMQNINIFPSLTSFRGPNYFSLYVVDGTFQVFTWPARGYLGTDAVAEFDRLTDNLCVSQSYRTGAYFDGATHVYQSPMSWLNYRSVVHNGQLYTGDWQSFSMLYPREHGLVIKQSSDIALRVDDRGAVQLRGRILVDGPVLVKMLSEFSLTNDLVMEWRASTGGVPFRVEGGSRVRLPGAVFTIDNDEAGVACVEVDGVPVCDLHKVTITGAPTGVAAVTVRHSHLHIAGDFAAPVQDYGDAAVSGGIIRVGCHSDVSIQGASTGKNTNGTTSDPLVVRTLSSVCLPASGYNLLDGADQIKVYLGAKGSGQDIPASGQCVNDLILNPLGNEEMVAVYRN